MIPGMHPRSTSSASEQQVICISAVTILLDKPIGHPVFIKLLLGEHEISQKHFNGQDQELRWSLDSALFLHSDSRVAVQLCEPSFFWWPKIVVEASIASRDILHLYTNLTTYQEIQLTSIPAITIEVINPASHQMILEGTRRMLKARKNALDSLERVRMFVPFLQARYAVTTGPYPNINSIVIATNAIYNHIDKREVCDVVVAELMGDMAGVIGCIEQSAQVVLFSEIIRVTETVLPLIEAATDVILNYSSDSSSASVQINELRRKFGDIKQRIIRDTTAPATAEFVDDNMGIPFVGGSSATRTKEFVKKPTTNTEETVSPEQNTRTEQPIQPQERPSCTTRPSGRSTKEPDHPQGRPSYTTEPCGRSTEEPDHPQGRPSYSTESSGLSAEEPDHPQGRPTYTTEPSGRSTEEPDQPQERPSYTAKPSGRSQGQPQGQPSYTTVPSDRSTEQPARPAGRSTNVTVMKAIADALKAFKSSLAPGVGISLRRIRLEKASRLFRQLEFQCNLENLALVKKQLLLTLCEAIKLFPYSDTNKADAKTLLSQVDEVLNIWTWQYVHHRAGFLECTPVFRSTLSLLPHFARQSAHSRDIFRDLQLQLSKSVITSDPLILSLRIESCHVTLEDTLHQAIRHFEAGRWAPAMSLLQSQDGLIGVLVDMEEAYIKAAALDRSWTPLEGFECGRARLTRVDFDMQLAMCRASQLIYTGDMHFQQAETGDAEDMMGRVHLAQDDYRAALFCVTGQDIELEGAALSRLARFYSKIVKLPVPAHQLYLRAVQLAAALSPALPKGSWYAESVAAVQKHRDELQAQEANEWAAKREPILQKLSADIAKLNTGKTMSNREFCEFVFKEWPPKTEGAAEPPQDPLNPRDLSKKHLLKVIQRYHTDRNSQSGEEWIVLCEEISKELTNRYNALKEVN